MMAILLFSGRHWPESRSLNARTSVFHLGRLFAQGSFREIEENDAVHQIYLGKR